MELFFFANPLSNYASSCSSRCSSSNTFLTDGCTLEGLDKILKQKQARNAEDIVHGNIAAIIEREAVLVFGQLIEARASTPTRNVKAFKREEEAREWLGLPQDVDVWKWSRDNPHT